MPGSYTRGCQLFTLQMQRLYRHTGSVHQAAVMWCCDSATVLSFVPGIFKRWLFIFILEKSEIVVNLATNTENV